jgi:hypothetical protein
VTSQPRRLGDRDPSERPRVERGDAPVRDRGADDRERTTRPPKTAPAALECRQCLEPQPRRLSAASATPQPRTSTSDSRAIRPPWPRSLLTSHPGGRPQVFGTSGPPRSPKRRRNRPKPTAQRRDTFGSTADLQAFCSRSRRVTARLKSWFPRFESGSRHRRHSCTWQFLSGAAHSQVAATRHRSAAKSQTKSHWKSTCAPGSGASRSGSSPQERERDPAREPAARPRGSG